MPPANGHSSPTIYPYHQAQQQEAPTTSEPPTEAPDATKEPSRRARKVSLRPASQQEVQLALKRQKQLETAVAKAAAIRSRVRRLGGGNEPAPGAPAVAGPGVVPQSGNAGPAAGTATAGGAAAPSTSGGRPAAARPAVGLGIMKDFSNSAVRGAVLAIEACEYYCVYAGGPAIDAAGGEEKVDGDSGKDPCQAPEDSGVWWANCQQRPAIGRHQGMCQAAEVLCGALTGGMFLRCLFMGR